MTAMRLVLHITGTCGGLRAGISTDAKRETQRRSEGGRELAEPRRGAPRLSSQRPPRESWSGGCPRAPAGGPWGGGEGVRPEPGGCGMCGQGRWGGGRLAAGGARPDDLGGDRGGGGRGHGDEGVAREHDAHAHGEGVSGERRRRAELVDKLEGVVPEGAGGDRGLDDAAADEADVGGAVEDGGDGEGAAAEEGWEVG